VCKLPGVVMPALVAGIHVLIAVMVEDVDCRDKPGHDGLEFVGWAERGDPHAGQM
jgi:hypothetical protein